MRAPGLPHGVTMCGAHSSCTCRENVTSNKSRQQHNLGPHQMCFGFLFSVRFFIVQHARKQFRAIPFHHQDSSRSFTNPRAILSPPGLEPLFHQLSGHSFTTRTRAALTPQRLPFCHRQDSTHAVCARPSWMRLWAPSNQSLGSNAPSMMPLKFSDLVSCVIIGMSVQPTARHPK